MSNRLSDLEEQRKIITAIERDFAEPFKYHGCEGCRKEDLLKHFQSWDNMFSHVDNVRFVYRGADFKDKNGKTYKKPMPEWFEKKYKRDFSGPLPNDTINLGA